MAQRYRCRILRRTNRLIRSLRNSSQASAFRWRASQLSFLSRAERYSILPSAVIQVRGTANWECFAKLWDILLPGDILLADRYMCAWHEIYLLKQRGIDTVTRVHHCRRVDFRRGKRLGKDDHIVEWRRPGRIRSIDWQTLKSLPERLTIRETRVRSSAARIPLPKHDRCFNVVGCRGGDCQRLGRTLSCRWNAELDLRSLKQTMQMDILRCKTPELVRKEIWTHILAYNLIRTIIAQAATKHRHRAENDQLQGSDSNTGSISAAHRHAR